MLRRAGLLQATRSLLRGGLIVATGVSAAVVVVKAMSLDLAPSPPAPAPPPDSVAPEKKSRRSDDAAAILRRNLFGAADLEVADPADPEAPAVGNIELRLRGIATSDGASFAVFENTASREQNVFAVGDKVFDGPKLVAVDPAGADVILRGRRKRYEIEDDGATPGGDGPAGESRSTGDKAGAEAAGSGIRKTGDNAYLVDRREVEHAVANLNQVVTQARGVPVMEGGKSTGIKVLQIRQGSIFEKLGLRDGDIVQRVNDTELNDPSRWLGLLEEIQSMQQIRLNFVRGGRPQTYTYTIR